MAESRITIVNPDCAVCCQHSYANDHLAHQGKNEQPLLTLMVLLLAVLLGAKMIRASSVFSHKHRGGSVFFSFSQTPTATGPRRGRTCRFSSTLTDLPSSDGISGRSSSPKARKAERERGESLGVAGIESSEWVRSRFEPFQTTTVAVFGSFPLQELSVCGPVSELWGDWGDDDPPKLLFDRKTEGARRDPGTPPRRCPAIMRFTLDNLA